MARFVAGCLMLLALVMPQGARAASTFGADVSQSVSSPGGCGVSAGEPCSFFTETTSTGVLESGSPMNGALVSVRLRHYNSVLPVQIALRTFRATGTPGQYLNVGPEIPATVPEATTPAGEVSQFVMHKRIAAGDRLGLGFEQPSYTFYFLAGGGPQVCRFRKGSGSEHSVDTVAPYNIAGCPYEVLIAGTVEPDADGDGYGDETQDGCPSDASVQGDCPAPPEAHDSQPPVTRLGGPRTQDAVAKRRVVVYATSNEAALLRASGTISVPGAASVLKLRSATRSAPAQTRTRLELKLGRKVVRRLRSALRRGAKPRARVAVTAMDAAGNAASVRRTIRIRHRR